MATHPVLIWYTNAPVDTGKVFTASEVCAENKANLLAESLEMQELEKTLESVRREEYPDLPSRLCSIVTVPFTYYESSEEVQSRWKTEPVRIPEPFGNLPYCYWVQPMAGFKRHLSDESLLEIMLSDGPKYWEGLARDYWEGVLNESYTFLFEGGFTVVESCLVGNDPAPTWKWDA